MTHFRRLTVPLLLLLCNINCIPLLQHEIQICRQTNAAVHAIDVAKSEYDT